MITRTCTTHANPVMDARWDWHSGDFGLWYTWELESETEEGDDV